MALDFRSSDPGRAPASELLRAVLAEYDLAAGRALSGGPLVTRAEFSPPRGGYLIGWEAGVATCGGGIRDVGAGIAEVKRMYVVPRFRGRRYAHALLLALEDLARELGYRTARLDSTAATWAMYVDAGYREIPDYNGNPHADFWGEKRL